MECPVCGSSEIIWDNKNGEVVCSNCGTIIDSIYYSEQNEPESTETIIINNKFYKDEILIKKLRIKNFLKNNRIENKKTDRYEIILRSILLDSQYKKIYKVLYNEGILSGLKAKSKLGLLIYFRFALNDQYLHQLEQFGIKNENLKKRLRRIGWRRLTLIFDKLNEESDRI
ncbi:transcription initiation factor IIB family protein [Sulfolobus sp. E5-1-F]|uniref:TFIIB-type zinc ribbon-containing protein n=1 Tax=Sulfolobaceae TaxID=118883 RepID=UPI001297AFD9|nr:MULTISPECIES: TFIIB-type zinc ribbon-containing protein [unclassified Sulfolobus]QGA54921.1 transcription initiation factor IIB family protein [Sulfolobus sp. E5-1-F]QGA67753.1 transcription initiation factor IIB family protein [Sulfolobus sp. E11-6]